jgi:penicillin amidase
MIYFFILLTSLSSFATSDIRCEATYDEIGVTRQKVNSLNDFYYCFGYHHAKDRAWMMDYLRRIGQGRNAEVYGYSSLKSDLMMRLLDLPKLAAKLYQGLPAQNKDWLKAYSAGANVGFQQGKNAQEFKDLNYAPEEWEPVDSILILVLQSFDQTRKTFYRDYEEEKLKEHWKEKTEEMFNEDNVPWFNTILKEGEYIAEVKPKIKTTYTPALKPKLWDSFPDVFGKESGSNNWVVSKTKSKSGFAMLANDPHLDLKTPLFWYWMNLQTPELNVIGGTIPGVPVIVSGTNGKVAWGLTNAYINTADAVFLKDYPEDHLVSFRPTVNVKFGFLQIPFFFKSFEHTKNGDVVLPLELENKDKMILRWAGFNLQSHDLISMFNLMNTKNVTEMDEHLKHVGLPAWNYVFADTNGDIGYRVVGHILKGTQKDPYGISYEKFDELNSKKFLDPMERPHVLKPKRNYVYSANNRHWPVNSKFYGGRAYSYSFRGFRIDELLKDGKHDVDSFKRIQCDRQVVDARFFVEKLLRVTDIPEFKGWDFTAQENSMAPSVYRRLMDLLLEGWQVNEYGLFHLLDKLRDEQKSELKSFYKVAKEQIAGRSWNDFHRLTFAHLSKNDDWKFSPEIPGIGDNHSVDPGTSKWDPDLKTYEQYSGASMRMIIVMKEVPEIHLSLPGHNRNYTQKQSSVPAWNEWRSCSYNKISFK